MSVIPNLYMVEIEEILNGYVIRYGEIGDTKKEFTQRKVDALEIASKILVRAYENEVNNLRNNVLLSVVDTDTSGGNR